MQNDGRFSRPSASAFPRIAACPASWPLSQRAIASGMAPGDSRDSRHGDAVHEVLARGDIDEAPVLTRDQEETMRRCQRQESEVVSDWHVAGTTEARNIREHRLYMMQNGEVYDDVWGELRQEQILFSGQTDSIWLEEGRGLVVEYKSLPGEVEHAEGNLQCMANAVLAAGRWNLKSVRVAIVQPLAGAPTCADYGMRELEKAVDCAEEIVRRADASDGTDTNPGAWCNFCPAALICSARHQEVRIAMHMEPALERLASPDMAGMLDILPRIKKFVDAVESVARQRIENGETIPGWTLKDKNGPRKIGDVHNAYQRLPLGPAEFIKCCKPSVPDIEDALVSGGFAKRKDVKQFVADALGPNLTQSVSKILTKVKELPQ